MFSWFTATLPVCCTWYMHNFCENQPVIMILANVQENCNLVLFVRLLLEAFMHKKKNLLSVKQSLVVFILCIHEFYNMAITPGTKGRSVHSR